MPISAYLYIASFFTYWYYTSIDHKVAIIIVLVFCPHYSPFQALPFYLLSYYDRKYFGYCHCVVLQKNIGPWKFKVTAAVVFDIPTSFTKASGWEGLAFGHWHSNNTTHHIYFQKQQVNLPCRRTLAQSCQKHWGPYIKLSESCIGNVELSDNFSICAELQINIYCIRNVFRKIMYIIRAARKLGVDVHEVCTIISILFYYLTLLSYICLL